MNQEIKEFHLFAGIGGGIYGGEFIPLFDSMISAQNKLHNHKVYTFADAKDRLSELNI